MTEIIFGLNYDLPTYNICHVFIAYFRTFTPMHFAFTHTHTHIRTGIIKLLNNKVDIL